MTPIRRGPRTALWLLALALLTLLASSLLIYNGLQGLSGSPVHIVIDGNEISSSMNLASMPPAHKVVLAFGLAFAVLAALMIVPVALLIAIMAVVVALLFAVGIPALVLLLVLGTVLSPFIALALLVWWALRRKRAPSQSAAPSATILA